MRTFLLAGAAVIALAGSLPRHVDAQTADSGTRRRLARELDLAEGDLQAPQFPSIDSVRQGGLTIAAGETRRGPVAVSRGDLVVNGTVTGDAMAIDGNVIVQTGGRITGDAVAVRGRVRLDGGTIEGEMRTLSNFSAPEVVAVARTPWQETTRALQIATTVFAIAIGLGLGILLLAGDTLHAVARTLEASFSRSFIVGLVGQLAIAPVLALGLIALAITILGLLLIPFATVAYVLAVVGMAVLGFLALAEVTGTAIAARKPGAGSARGVALRALLIGTAIYLGLWILAAAFTWQPVLGGILRVFAATVTWVAITAGFGAVILSRGGQRRPQAALEEPMQDIASWQTPTPVGGVAAARRPTPASYREVR